MLFLPAPALENLFRLHLRLWPDALHSRAIRHLWNVLMKSQPSRARLTELEGKRIAIGLTDTGNHLAFRIRNGGIHPLTSRAGWDVRIRGSTANLTRLALGREDADTLFFTRRVTMEGETAAGVCLKNLLDSLEFDWEAPHQAITARLPTPLRKPGRRLLHRLSPEERLASLIKGTFRGPDRGSGESRGP